MDDYLPEETALLNRLVGTVRELFRLYGYSEVETPAVEYYELFAAKSGVEILEHMYVFKDAHGRLLALRPEMTAPIARLVAGKMSRRPLPLRLGYVADCYRLDEPQWGRRRRFYHGGLRDIRVAEPAHRCRDIDDMRGLYEEGRSQRLHLQAWTRGCASRGYVSCRDTRLRAGRDTITHR
jgi:histidyl-tRNA synthetase